MYEEIINKVINDYNLVLIDIKDNPSYIINSGMSEETYINNSYRCGNEIILGIYDNDEIRLASFFHELRHGIDIPKEKKEYLSILGYEKWAWKNGYKVTKKYNVKFSSRVNNYIKLCLKTYKKKIQLNF